MDACPKAVHAPFHAALQAIFEASDRKRAVLLLRPLLEEFATTAPRAVAVLEDGIEDALAIFAYPPEIGGGNGHADLPNRASAERLLGAVLMEQHDASSTGR